MSSVCTPSPIATTLVTGPAARATTSGDDPQPVAYEQAILVEALFTGSDDHPLKVVEVRSQVALLAPADDVAA